MKAKCSLEVTLLQTLHGGITLVQATNNFWGKKEITSIGHMAVHLAMIHN